MGGGRPKAIKEEIDRGFEYYLDGIDFDINADAPLDYDVGANKRSAATSTRTFGAPAVIGRWRYGEDFPSHLEPAAASPVAGTTVDLEVSYIEDAGIREVLQTLA
ncbi:hypothetical protein SAZ10_15695 [Mesorhizobium sp. BAC0120]|uniref:hypothetical protein n=1 Tax=Mesorhizobium sp. BAC0120 TaxID=3090670 RepID=UPI00298C7D5B|nr:hypothetical protein [Mesorhizobium sp. BAC0120]MDW6023201.1 hypothetical protein [Mesorhizobium sp. BAC0120]